MARPIKDGVDYFPLDTDFFEDKKIKLIRAEFGTKGIVVLLALFCEIYRDYGYWRKWDDDDCYLMAEAVGCGLTSENIKQVVQGCLRRSIFDRRVFQAFGVLTSAGIQRRYIRMLRSRKNISIIQEYWLLDNGNENEVPASVLNKVTFFHDESAKNPIKNEGNKVKCAGNTQIEKEIEKEKEIESNAANPLLQFPNGLRETVEKWLCYKSERRESYWPTGLHSLLEQVQKYRQTATDEQICALIETCMANGWKGITWDRLPGKERQPQNQSARTGGYHSLDARELDDLIKKAAM